MDITISIHLKEAFFQFSLFQILYILIALIFVIWQGVYFEKWHPKSIVSIRYHDLTMSEKIREIMLNFLGSSFGWLTGYYLIFYRHIFQFNFLDLKATDLVLFLIFFYGINGQLPNVLFNKVLFGK